MALPPSIELWTQFPRNPYWNLPNSLHSHPIDHTIEHGISPDPAVFKTNRELVLETLTEVQRGEILAAEENHRSIEPPGPNADPVDLESHYDQEIESDSNPQGASNIQTQSQQPVAHDEALLSLSGSLGDPTVTSPPTDDSKHEPDQEPELQSMRRQSMESYSDPSMPAYAINLTASPPILPPIVSEPSISMTSAATKPDSPSPPFLQVASEPNYLTASSPSQEQNGESYRARRQGGSFALFQSVPPNFHNMNEADVDKAVSKGTPNEQSEDRLSYDTEHLSNTFDSTNTTSQVSAGLDALQYSSANNAAQRNVQIGRQGDIQPPRFTMAGQRRNTPLGTGPNAASCQPGHDELSGTTHKNGEASSETIQRESPARSPTLRKNVGVDSYKARHGSSETNPSLIGERGVIVTYGAPDAPSSSVGSSPPPVPQKEHRPTFRSWGRRGGEQSTPTDNRSTGELIPLRSRTDNDEWRARVPHSPTPNALPPVEHRHSIGNDDAIGELYAAEGQHSTRRPSAMGKLRSFVSRNFSRAHSKVTQSGARPSQSVSDNPYPLLFEAKTLIDPK
ncbi:hypothetical protein FH972_026207 [Carpinus fangiana]|uniref:Uncharacterized protein n=1 Tax=Carpinus fangiana TaxID=176857 RepID=A0A5N6L3A0_9ROSI|nr:hypothetical protein FH972_026207 [Carpinus fangiana]